MVTPLTPEEKHERLDGPIHQWFGLTYSNYLVLHRALMQSMPVAWQQRAVALFDELDNAFPDQERAPLYNVQPADECEYADLSEEQLKQLGITCSDIDPDFDRPDSPTVYWDRDGGEHQPRDRILLPAGDDPVPHYNRGRTFIEGTA